MNKALVAEGDQFTVVTLKNGEKSADLPIGQLPLDDVQVSLGDGRTVHVKYALGGTVIQVTDLKGDVIGDYPVPAQKPELVAKAAQLRKVAERMTERLQSAIDEAEKAMSEANRDEATALPAVIPLPSPQKLN